MSCRVLKNNSKHFWKEVHKVRGNAKTLINYVDGVQGQDIADLFADKYDILYNSVSYDNTDMVTLKHTLVNVFDASVMTSNLNTR